ncbi:MAG TPA: hypothetical protein VNE82_11575 [Candidatus Binataceae bacterium]|nr:hypothetical protein [Candidatus Binataceae bacterium]
MAKVAIFERRPPGSFPLCADPSFDPYAAGQLRTLVEAVSLEIGEVRPLGVILTGSLARGEGALASAADRATRWLSDIECLVVFADAAAQWRGSLGEALDKTAAKLEAAAKAHAVGLDIQLVPMLASRLARMRPAIFTRELAEHGKLLWGAPGAIPMPAPELEDARLLRADAFRLLNNRIMEQVAARARCEEGRAAPCESGYALSKFWTELATSLSVFLDCYRPSYRERQGAMHATLASPHGPLAAEIARDLLQPLDAAMRLRRGEFDATQWPREAGFARAAGLAQRIWHWESGRMLAAADEGAAGAGDWRAIPARLRRVATLSQCARDWLRWFLRPDVSRRMSLRAVSRAWRAGSPGNAIYAAGCLLDFFWSDIGSQSVRGREIVRLLGPLLGFRSRRRPPLRPQLVARAVTAWRSHLRDAAL